MRTSNTTQHVPVLLHAPPKKAAVAWGAATLARRLMRRLGGFPRLLCGFAERAPMAYRANFTCRLHGVLRGAKLNGVPPVVIFTLPCVLW